VEQTQTSGGMTTLQFTASTTYATKPAPAPANSEWLTDFFFRDQHRDMLLTGGDNNLVELIREPDVGLYHLWDREASRCGFAKPVVGDAILRVTTKGVNFPGVVLRVVGTLGCKKVDLPTGPELQTTLLGDELHAEGSEPLVWAFNKLTGSGGDRKGRGQGLPDPVSFLFDPFQTASRRQSKPEKQRKTHSTNRIAVENTVGGLVFCSTARLSIDVSFPTVLLNVLPVSKRMAEEQGSAAILKVVERDIGPSLEKLRMHYLNCLKAE
jgi:hypothetical protein